MMRAPACVLAATVVVSVTTAASEAGKVSLGTLASTPQGVFQGRVWLLLTSALVADHPIGPSLITFAGLGLVAVAVCGWRVVWAAATLGHAGSAIAVYGAIAGLRIIDPAAFRDARSLYDYGTSAVIAAWLGAIAARAWRRRTRTLDHVAIVALCLGSGLIGWLLRPDVTPLDSEHVVAFVIGVCIARFELELAPLRRAAAWTTARLRAPAQWRLEGHERLLALRRGVLRERPLPTDQAAEVTRTTGRA